MTKSKVNALNQDHFDRLVNRARALVHQHGLLGTRAEVVLALDVSEPMLDLYAHGVVSELATRLLALALHFDDDGVIPVWAFGDTPRSVGALRASDFVGFVSLHVLRSDEDIQRGCAYAPVLHEIGRALLPAEWDRPARSVRRGLLRRRGLEYPGLAAPRRHPIFAIIVTHGDPDDPDATVDAIRRSSHLPIFWQFAGVQPPDAPASRGDFRFLRRLERLRGTHVANCGFFAAADLDDSEALYRGLLGAFPAYLQRPEVRAMLRPSAAQARARSGARVNRPSGR